MSIAADQWRAAVLDLAAWRVAAGLATADARDRVYGALRRLQPGPGRERIADTIRVGLALGTPDGQSALERLYGVSPLPRPSDWLDRLLSAAAPRRLEDREAAYTAIGTLAAVDHEAADHALATMLDRLARVRPVPAPLPVEVELLVDLVVHEPPLADARDLLAAAARARVADWRLARAVRETRAARGEPWASWLAWTAAALQSTMADTR